MNIIEAALLGAISSITTMAVIMVAGRIVKKRGKKPYKITKGRANDELKAYLKDKIASNPNHDLTALAFKKDDLPRVLWLYNMQFAGKHVHIAAAAIKDSSTGTVRGVISRNYGSVDSTEETLITPEAPAAVRDLDMLVERLDGYFREVIETLGGDMKDLKRIELSGNSPAEIAAELGKMIVDSPGTEVGIDMNLPPVQAEPDRQKNKKKSEAFAEFIKSHKPADLKELVDRIGIEKLVMKYGQANVDMLLKKIK